MDNLTHTLVGVCLGKSFKFDDKIKRRAALATGIIASNFPDLDILYSSIGGVEQLGYLLHHRGHTHTLALFPFVALFSWVIGTLITTGKLKWDGKVFVIAILGAFLHLCFDFLNSYGVHPFWPLDNSWVYGDSLFIIEPSIWFGLLAFAVCSAESKWGRGFWALTSLAAVLALWIMGPGGMILKILLSLFFLVMIGLQAKTRGNIRLAWASLVSILTVFISCSLYSEYRLRTHFAKDFQKEEILQLSRSPQPGNPFCWNNILVTELEPQLYIVRSGYQSLLPHIINCQSGRRVPEAEGMRLLNPPIESSLADDEIYWDREYLNSMVELRGLYINNCRARAALRFYRAPYWQAEEVMDDLRYAREGSFARIDIGGESCPQFVPNWSPPLESVLELQSEFIDLEDTKK